MPAFLARLPLVLLTYFAVHLSVQAVVHEVDARVRTTSSVSSLC